MDTPLLGHLNARDMTMSWEEKLKIANRALEERARQVCLSAVTWPDL